MTPPRSLPLLALGATLLSAAPAAAADFPIKKRPHTRVATYVRNGVAVQRLQASVKPAGARLRIAVDARIHNDLKLVTSVTLRAGACAGTSLAFPTCPDAVRIEVPVAPGTTVSVKRTVTVPVPRRAIDRVMITIARHGTLPRGLRGVYGQLLLNGHAWRGAGVGRAFGLDLTPDRGTSLQRMLVDAAGINPGEMRGDVAWTAGSSDGATLSTGLAGRALNPDTDVPAGGMAASFFDRPYIKVTTKPSAFSALVQTSAGADLATVRLPWPS
jgi:hypothetical protein